MLIYCSSPLVAHQGMGSQVGFPPLEDQPTSCHPVPQESPSAAERGPAEEGSLSTTSALPSKDSVGTERTGAGQAVCFSGQMPILDTKVIREDRATSQHHPQPRLRPGCVAFTRTSNPPHQHLWVPWHKMLLQDLLLQYSPSQQCFGHRTPNVLILFRTHDGIFICLKSFIDLIYDE